MPSSPGQCSSPSTRDPNGYSGASGVTVLARTGPRALEGEGTIPQFPSPLVGSQAAPSRPVLGAPPPQMLTSNHRPRKTHDSRSQHPPGFTVLVLSTVIQSQLIYIYICIYIPLNYTIMYKTGALLRPQHFSECHKCQTNEVRSWVADVAGQPRPPAEPG